MADKRVRIGVVCPASTMPPETAGKVTALVSRLHPDGAVEVVFHPQCFLSEGHFAGGDQARADAFVEMANDADLDAVWFGRGGYGSCRIAAEVLPRLTAAARAKAYLGYSDGGTLLAALYGQGFGHVAHGPVPRDIDRPGGEAAAARALAWLVDRDPGSLEPSVGGSGKTAAFNMVILSSLIGTPLAPDLGGHVLMLEEVSEYMYRIDRMLWQITSNPALRGLAGIRLGRCSDIPENDPPFGMEEVEVCRFWCERSGIPYLGRADIGHDADNKVVPFGTVG